MPLLAAVTGAWFAIRWYIGNTLAPYAINANGGGLEIARAAAQLAPDDPQTHWSIAEIEKRGLTSEGLSEAIRQYEAAVVDSPNDYRLWLDLGRGREQFGDVAGGEQALRRAVELAPNYSLPYWYLGNILVRQGKLDDGFAKLRFAGSRDENLLGPIFDLAWHIYDGDVRAISERLGDAAKARTQLTAYLLKRARFDDALKLWDSLRPAEKQNERTTGEALVSALLQAKRYRDACALKASFAVQGAAAPQVGQIQNGGFENDTGPAANGMSAFSWQIQAVPQVQIAIDTRIRHSGERSLRIVFNAPANVTFTNISQLVAVEPTTRYRLQCFVRTKDLRSAGTPTLEVASANDAAVLGASTPLPVGTTDWQQITIDFTTGAKTEGVTLRTNRATCGVDAVCPIFGFVWYDDFNLQRLGTSIPSPRR